MRFESRREDPRQCMTEPKVGPRRFRDTDLCPRRNIDAADTGDAIDSRGLSSAVLWVFDFDWHLATSTLRNPRTATLFFATATRTRRLFVALHTVHLDTPRPRRSV